ncbi:MAG: cbb3-type cytochrome c oxidase subunit I [Thermoleophilia bacterium]
MEEHRQGDRAVLFWFFCSLLWFPLFASVGFILAVKFFQPTFLTHQSWLTFGRLRPAHVNGLLFGFLSSGLIAGMLYVMPRLCRAPLKSPTLAKAAAIMWNGAILAGVILILGGYSQGREYAELPWVIDVAVMVTLALLAFIVLGTLVKRTERKLYVSNWYYAGTVLWFPVVYLIGNVMWNPPVGALNGTMDAIFNWYYGHNVLGLWFTTLGIPAWYYFIPRGVKRPLYSHLLSLIAFFTIAFFYTGVGAHHLLQAPVPEWLRTLAVIESILMLVPIVTFATNILLTVRGAHRTLIENIPLRFVMTGFVLYILTSFQGSFQALRGTNSYVHFSQYTVGHAHLAFVGGFAFLVVGLAYWLVPKITNVKIYSYNLMRLSFWLIFLGFITFFTAMTVAGLVANAAWWNHMGIAQTLPLLPPFFVLRAMGGGVIVVGAFVFAINLLMTMARSRKPYVAYMVEEHPGKESTRKHSEFQRKSQEKLSLPVIMVGGFTLFIIMTFMVVAMPYMYSPDKPSDRARELTAQEKRGESHYKDLGCFYCHSQFVRPQDWAMGETSLAGDFFYSVPHFLGTERTGPNLAQIGGMRPTEWHYLHDRYPRSVSPGSIMPNFAFLSDTELDDLVAYIQHLGGKDLETRAFQPIVPEPYRDKMNPNMPLMLQVMKTYNRDTNEYSGNPAIGEEFGKMFEEGKSLYAQKCISCHGGSGNGQGPYARDVITRPANLNERLSNYPKPDAPFQFWRVSEGVPGTAMPPWGQSLSETEIWKINTYEISFIDGALRTISGNVSDQEAKDFSARSNAKPQIRGTAEDYNRGKELYTLYCAQCHGANGEGDGIASVLSKAGYISPKPASFPETGGSFKHYGQYLWKVRQGVETTNMPPWKYVLSDPEMARVIFFIQGFSAPDDYNAKWAPLYEDDFARNLKKQG